MLCIAMAALWISGNQSAIYYRFHWHHVAWEVVAEEGRFDLDNEPQCKIEYAAAIPVMQELDETRKCSPRMASG